LGFYPPKKENNNIELNVWNTGEDKIIKLHALKREESLYKKPVMMHCSIMGKRCNIIGN